jgi:hypothetical protein
MQTDEWVPPVVPTTPSRSVAILSPGSSLAILPPATPERSSVFRLGSASQQFQFVASPSHSSVLMPSPSSGSIRDLNATFRDPNATFRDSNATFTGRPRTSTSDRRQSIESAMSSFMEGHSRARTQSSNSPAVDRTRPPTMAMPPPPRQPPPPVAKPTMPPPSFIPERRIPTKSNASAEAAPLRPSSPPPPELVKRATTPSLHPAASIHARNIFAPRQSGSSMPPQQGVRPLPSTSSFRSAANAASHAQGSSAGHGSLLAPVPVRGHQRRELSATSLASNGSLASPRSSISSDHMYTGRMSSLGQAGGLDGRPDFSNRVSMNPTDPTVIHAITQTMIGEYLYKYTRRTIGKGHGERRHKRFFWVHPYTKTLYWGSSDPGSAGVTESTAKSGM